MKTSVSTPSLNEEDQNYVLEALKAGEISGNFGRFIKEFENGFAEYCGAKFGVATSSGTTALHLAFAALGIGSGDEVLVSTFTNMATFFAVHYTGAKPVPIDIEPDTLNMNPALLEAKITPKTKAITVVHIYGHPVDMDPILEIARKYNLFVIEDAAEAHGAEYKKRKIGSLSDIACFSFYANKIITTGEGGMVVTNNEKLANRARSLKSLAFGDENKFMHKEIGFNYRLTNFQAALGVSQLKRIESIIEKKRKIADFYKNELKEIADIQLPVEKPYAKNVYWMFHVVLKGALKSKRKEVMTRLDEKGIETREAFIPYNMQEIFIERGWTREDECPVANEVAENGFYLPSGPDLKEVELKYVADSLKEIIKRI